MAHLKGLTHILASHPLFKIVPKLLYQHQICHCVLFNLIHSLKFLLSVAILAFAKYGIGMLTDLNDALSFPQIRETRRKCGCMLMLQAIESHCRLSNFTGECLFTYASYDTFWIFAYFLPIYIMVTQSVLVISVIFLILFKKTSLYIYLNRSLIFSSGKVSFCKLIPDCSTRTTHMFKWN